MYKPLLHYWFSDEVSQYWFNAPPDFDHYLRETYVDLWEQGKNGDLNDWGEQADGSLALVILLDQLPLNMFRGTAKSFSTEAQSRVVASMALERQFDLDMPAQRKAFLYMPFMHSENLDDQARSLQLFNQPGLEHNFRFARHHHAIIEQFGRFPHRNEILGRESSAAEIEYLNSEHAFTG